MNKFLKLYLTVIAFKIDIDTFFLKKKSSLVKSTIQGPEEMKEIYL